MGGGRAGVSQRGVAPAQTGGGTLCAEGETAAVLRCFQQFLDPNWRSRPRPTLLPRGSASPAAAWVVSLWRGDNSTRVTLERLGCANTLYSRRPRARTLDLTYWVQLAWHCLVGGVDPKGSD